VDMHKDALMERERSMIGYYRNMSQAGRNTDDVHKKLNTYLIIVLNFPSSSFKSGVDSLEIMSGITL
jgi:hypothetical protein